MPETPHKLDLSKELAKGLTVHSNVKQEMIVTTLDRLRLCLIGSLKNAEAKGGWIGPVGVFLTLVATLVGAEFHDTWIISKGAWTVAFQLATGASLLWLIRSAWAAARAYSAAGTGDSIEAIVQTLKTHSGSITVDLSEQVNQMSAIASSTLPPNRESIAAVDDEISSDSHVRSKAAATQS